MSSKQPSKAKGQTKEKKGTAQKKRSGGSAIKYIVSIAIIIIIIGVAIFASTLLSGPSGSGGSFTIFQKNFDGAQRVDIFVTAYNGTVLSSTVGCATAIIEQLVANRSEHRNASTIDLNIINQTSCIRSSGLGTSNSSNYTVTSLQDCLNTSSTEPSIYINYSATNLTIIKPDYMYVSGDAIFLQECGLASEFS